MNHPTDLDLPRPPAALLRASSLFLDFDGTLVEIADRPEAVVVGDELRALLTRLVTALDGRVALLSGRAVANLAARLGGLDLTIGGSHGLETRHPDGTHDRPEAPAGLADAIARLRGLEQEHPGVQVEEKVLGVAVHYRGAPDAEQPCRDTAAEVAADHALDLQHGKMVVELKPAGADKGVALRRLMEKPPFAGTRPLFLGDDLTDEHGFEAAAALGGAGVLVGDPRETAARYRLESVGDALAWIDEAAGAIA